MIQNAKNALLNKYFEPSVDELTKKILAAVKAVQGNDCCADCGSRSPTWLSINLGILVCDFCAGVHREIGVNFSKIRSITLDKWGTANLLVARSELKNHSFLIIRAETLEMKCSMKFMKRIYRDMRSQMHHHHQLNIEQTSSSRSTYTKALFKRRSDQSKKALRRWNLRYKNQTCTQFFKLMPKELNRKPEEIRLA